MSTKTRPLLGIRSTAVGQTSRHLRQMGLEAIYRKPCTREAQPGHGVTPYLLGGLDIRHSYQVECADITYIPTCAGSCTWWP